jgi:hypothetical protein
LSKSRSVIVGLSVITLFLATSGYIAALGLGNGAGPQVTSVPTATLRAASGATITFKTQNGQTVGDVPPQTLDLPHLVLHRNGALTDPDERTLIVEVTGIEVPPTGVTVTLEVETQHRDPDLGGDSGQRIAVWRESRWITNTRGFTQTDVTAVFTHEFDETVISGSETIATPTDYFRYGVAVLDMNHPITNPLRALGTDYAFLMENQWVARLPEVQEESAGAAPDELIVYYCDMFPFQKSIHDPTTWLPREDVPDYVHTELAPQMIEAFRVQTDDWGFAWYHAWTSYRPGEGKDTERLSVALGDGRTWFHGRAPSRGHSGISIKVTGGENARYDTLTDGLMSTFHHELFHSLQRNIKQKNGGNGSVGGEADAWQFFSEGTAVLAPSVGQLLVQLAPAPGTRAYMSNANRFLGDGGLLGDLNTSYERMNPYRAAIYWRFLYEQCGGMKDGVEDAAAGMRVISRTLMVLYAGDIVDISSSTDLIGAVPEIMDRAIEGSSCPFKTYEESLIGFARAIYALRLDGGRCTEPGTPAGCGFYDPDNLYYAPPVSTITYSGADQQHPGEIESSFGMDFVDVILDPAADKQPLTLEFHPAPGADAEFSVQLWKLIDSGEGARPQRVPTYITATEILTRTSPDGHLLHVIPAINTTAYNRLGLIITRFDAEESSDPIGEYTIVLRADADSDDGPIPGGEEERQKVLQTAQKGNSNGPCDAFRDAFGDHYASADC